MRQSNCRTAGCRRCLVLQDRWLQQICISVQHAGQLRTGACQRNAICLQEGIAAGMQQCHPAGRRLTRWQAPSGQTPILLRCAATWCSDACMWQFKRHCTDSSQTATRQLGALAADAVGARCRTALLLVAAMPCQARDGCTALTASARRTPETARQHFAWLSAATQENRRQQ